ncbi:MAG TPA: universal stress protein [Microthrixaceae bacterium]|nr:universal stress protein [Microthrixaceae bacterium]
MSNMVMVAVDPQYKNSSALSWAIQWCRVTDQELLVVSAFHAEQAEVDPELHDELVAAAHKTLDDQVDRSETGVSGSAESVPYHSLIQEGDPSDVIIGAAKDRDVSLVVIGARGSGGFEQLGLGGVAHHVSHHLQRPLVVVPHEGGALVGGTVVVGVDGSPESRPALRWAVEAAKKTNSLLHAVFAYDPMADSYPHGDASNWRYKNEDAMREEIHSLHGPDVRLRITRVGNHPVEALTEVASDDDASVIVVGTRGHGGFRGLVLGRVPAQLLHHAGRPVALIHHEK